MMSLLERIEVIERIEALRARIADLENARDESLELARKANEYLTARVARLEAAMRDVQREAEEESGHSPEAGLATVWQIAVAALAVEAST